MNSSVEQHTEPLDQTAILSWIDEFHLSARSAPWAPLMDLDGVDALDVLLSPIYVAVLKTLRNETDARQPSSAGWISRARSLASRGKLAIRNAAAARRSAQPGPADVVLWSRDITHTVIFDPVARALREQGRTARLLACQSTIFDGLTSRDASSVFMRAAWPRKLRQAHRDGLQRAKELTRFGRWTVPRFSAAHDVEPAVRRTVIGLLPLVSEAVANSRAALETLGARLMVVGNDLTLEGRAGCRVARQRGIPTATFMHGNITGDPMHTRHCVDRILVFGNIHRDELARCGFPRERIVVCGAPSMDNRPQQTGRLNAELRERLGLQPGKPWILVATSGPGHRISLAHHHIVIQELAKLSAAVPAVPVVVKLHRKDRPEYYQAALQNDAARSMIVVSENTPGYPTDIFQWLSGCPVVLTGASTVAVEAMLMDVPVVTMDFHDEIHGVDFIDAGATTHVRSGEALVEAVAEILAGHAPSLEARSRVRAYLEESFCALDGRSASRAAQSLVEQIEQGTSR
jgi:hypothetical protein